MEIFHTHCFERACVFDSIICINKRNMGHPLIIVLNDWNQLNYVSKNQFTLLFYLFCKISIGRLESYTIVSQ